MAVKGYCKKRLCADCQSPCALDERIPCSPDCENLTEDGKILIINCLNNGCENVTQILDALCLSKAECIERYGAVVPYPYKLSEE